MSQLAITEVMLNVNDNTKITPQKLDEMTSAIQKLNDSLKKVYKANEKLYLIRATTAMNAPYSQELGHEEEVIANGLKIAQEKLAKTNNEIKKVKDILALLNEEGISDPSMINVFDRNLARLYKLNDACLKARKKLKLLALVNGNEKLTSNVIDKKDIDRLNTHLDGVNAHMKNLKEVAKKQSKSHQASSEQLDISTKKLKR